MSPLPILTAGQMKRADLYTIGAGTPSRVLIERAAAAMADFVETECTREKTAPVASRILVLCGHGNNGADGLACARFLTQKGFPVSVCLYTTDKPGPEWQTQYDLCRKAGVDLHSSLHLGGVTLILDALLGIGISRDIAGALGDLIDRVNDSGIPVLALDVPSGIDATTGAVRGHAIRACATLCISHLKTGVLLPPGNRYAGQIHCAPIGIDASPLEKEPLYYPALSEALASFLPSRDPDSNKSTYGKILCVAGSYDMAGAAVLCARAALRAGAGLVRIFTPECNRAILQSALPEALLTSYGASQEIGEKLQSALDFADCVVCGCGLSQSPDAGRILSFLLQRVGDKPLVLDADALNLLSAMGKDAFPLPPHTLLTPHPGEAARLLGTGVRDVTSDMPRALEALTERTRAVCVLKNSVTLIGSQDDPARYLFCDGTPALAKGGSGDVLAGVCGAMMARCGFGVRTAALAVLLHGKAGRLAEAQYGTDGVLASDVADRLGLAMRDLIDA